MFVILVSFFPTRTCIISKTNKITILDENSSPICSEFSQSIVRSILSNELTTFELERCLFEVDTSALQNPPHQQHPTSSSSPSSYTTPPEDISFTSNNTTLPSFINVALTATTSQRNMPTIPQMTAPTHRPSNSFFPAEPSTAASSQTESSSSSSGMSSRTSPHLPLFTPLISIPYPTSTHIHTSDCTTSADVTFDSNPILLSQQAQAEISQWSLQLQQERDRTREKDSLSQQRRFFQAHPSAFHSDKEILHSFS